MSDSFKYLDLLEEHSQEKKNVLLQEDLNAFNKLIPSLTKLENMFLQTFLNTPIGQSLGEQNLRGLIKPGLDILATGILLGGDEATKDSLEAFQNELNRFISGKVVPIVTKAKFGSGLQGIANKLKSRLNTSKGFLNKLKSIFNKSKEETEVRPSPEASSEAPAPTPEDVATAMPPR